MKIPESIKKFIVSPENMTRRVELMRRFSVSPDSTIKITKTVNLILAKEAGPDTLLDELKKMTDISPDNAQQIALAFAGYEFLPCSDYLGDVDSFIRSLGGNPSDYPAERIIIRDVLPQELVTEFLHEHPVNVPAFLEHRLREILESRVRGVRKDDDTVTRLTRAEKIGGAELSHDEAERLVEALAAKIASVSVASDNDVLRPVAELATPAPVEEKVEADATIKVSSVPSTHYSLPTTPSLNPSATSKKGDSFMPDDEREADVIRKHVLPNVVTSALFDLDNEVKAGTAIVLDATETPLSVPMLERYKTIITSRLKGVRDAAETRELLVREPAKGGLGFSAPDADKAAVAIERQEKAIHGKREEAVKNEKEVFVKNTVAASFAKDESRKKGEVEDLDRMYSSLTGKVSKTPVPEQGLGAGQALVPVAPSVVAAPAPQKVLVPAPVAAASAFSMSAPIQAPARPVELKTQNPPLKTSIPAPTPRPLPIGVPVPPKPPMAPPVSVVPKPTVPYVPPTPRSVSVPITPVTPAPSVPAYQTPPVAPSLSELTTRNSQLGTRMQDVRPLPAPAAPLTGPVQELANITLVDFRRLSADPVEACRKLSDKLDVLEEHSYARRIEGIKAWQTSPVYRLYLAIINAVFSGGKPLASAIAESLSAGRDTLTEREVRAIMDLGRLLKA